MDSESHADRGYDDAPVFKPELWVARPNSFFRYFGLYFAFLLNSVGTIDGVSDTSRACTLHCLSIHAFVLQGTYEQS